MDKETQNLQAEINQLAERLQSLPDELHVERREIRDKLLKKLTEQNNLINNKLKTI